MPQFRLLASSLKGRKGSGTADTNQDRVLARKLRRGGTELAVVAVADGISRCPDGGAVASYLIERHLSQDALCPDGDTPFATQLRKYLEKLHRGFCNEFADDPAMLESGSTLSVALLFEGEAHCFWAGDSPIFAARKKDDGYVVSQISTPDLCGRLLTDCFGAGAPFHLKARRTVLRRGDILVLASDGGVRDETQLAELLNAHGAGQGMLEALEKKVSQAPYYDDASVVLAERRV